MKRIKIFLQRFLVTSFVTVGIILVLLLFFSGFVGKNIDAHNVTSLNVDGKSFVNENEVKYLCEHQYEILFANFLVFKCKYIRDAKNETTSDFSGTTYTLRYNNLPQSYVDSFELQPDFSWWDKYGKLIITIVIWVGVFIYIEDLFL